MRSILYIIAASIFLSIIGGCSSGEVTTSDVEDWKKQGLSEEEAAQMPDPNADR